MNLRLVTVNLDPETGEFPPAPLAGIDGEILSVVEHFFHHDGLPHLLLVVHHRPPAADEKRRHRQREDPAAGLSAADRTLFEKLRAWRKGRAEADGVPVYVVLNNRQLAEIARRRPATLEELRRVEGVGEAKAGRYGRDLLQVVSQEASKPAEAAPPAAPGDGQTSAATATEPPGPERTRRRSTEAEARDGS